MEYMDRTQTPYGQRLLRKWIGMPLIDERMIEERLQSVTDLVQNY
jgi:DNA mismatch repair ATPase MutS